LLNDPHREIYPFQLLNGPEARYIFSNVACYSYNVSNSFWVALIFSALSESGQKAKDKKKFSGKFLYSYSIGLFSRKFEPMIPADLSPFANL
jgi:hypothetical protein